MREGKDRGAKIHNTVLWTGDGKGRNRRRREMTIVNLKGQKLDLISKCCKEDIIVENSVIHRYFCKKCKRECGVVVSAKDTWRKGSK